MSESAEEPPLSFPIRCIEGTRDYLDAEGRRFEKAFRIAAEVFGLYGYRAITTPVFEATGLFARSIGEATDIVEKEMYTFRPGSDRITLRPEGTAGVIRAYLQHNLHKQGGMRKLWYGGPMFRRERPQKGRQRQFHQVGVEAIGSGDPLLDAEVVAMGLRYYAGAGIDGVETRINSIGCPDASCRPAYRERLREAIRPELDAYCKRCRERFDRNILRLLDCKHPECRAMAARLPQSHEHLCPACDAHFAGVKEGLDAHGVTYSVDGTLVRGLDYYTRTVFEFRHDALGAQDAIGGGGRYDGLVEELGGPPTPAVGFALGVERILIAMEALGACACEAPLQVFAIGVGEAGHRAAHGLIERLRAAGFSADMDYEGRSFKAQMRMANRRGALAALLVGEEELGRGVVGLKDMREGGGQEEASLGGLEAAVARLLRPSASSSPAES